MKDIHKLGGIGNLWGAWGAGMGGMGVRWEWGAGGNAIHVYRGWGGRARSVGGMGSRRHPWAGVICGQDGGTGAIHRELGGRCDKWEGLRGW